MPLLLLLVSSAALLLFAASSLVVLKCYRYLRDKTRYRPITTFAVVV